MSYWVKRMQNHIPEKLSDQDICNCQANIKTAQLHLKHLCLFVLTFCFIYKMWIINVYIWNCPNPNPTSTPPNLKVSLGFMQKWLGTPPPPPPLKTQCRQYLSCYWHGFDQTLKVDSWDHLEQIPTITMTDFLHEWFFCSAWPRLPKLNTYCSAWA